MIRPRSIVLVRYPRLHAESQGAGTGGERGEVWRAAAGEVGGGEELNGGALTTE